MAEDSEMKKVLDLIAAAKRSGESSLDLSGYELSGLPAEIGGLSELEYLDITDNQISELPPEIGQLKALKRLDASRNNIYSLPPEIGELAALEELTIDENVIGQLPPEVGQLESLTQLGVRDNALGSLPSEIGLLKSLTDLSLTNNHFETLPDQIGKLQSLERLSAGFNQISELPKTIGDLIALTDLNVSYNKIKLAPPELGKLENLERLHIAFNQISKFPSEIRHLNNLSTLDIGHNPLKSLPPELVHLKALRSLHLAGLRFTTLPSEVCRLHWLTNLNLEQNQLSTLPPELGDLTNLEQLSLDENLLTALPSAVCRLQSLKVLRANLNSIRSLPPEIGELTELVQLFMDSNELEELPPEIGGLESMVDLNFDDNMLNSLPSEIGQLSLLKELYLDSNQLTSLPPEIGLLTELSSLHAMDNKISTLPTEMHHLENLIFLDLEGNPLPMSIQAAREDGIDALRTLLKNLDDPSKVKVISEVKLMITGEGNVGKTSLRKALDEDAIVLKREPTTWGVECGQFPLKHPRSPDREITFNYWDFGGQAIYRVTHQFFFSRDGIYLLLWHPREGEERGRVRDWLDKIHARTAGKAKVILIATHAKEEAGGTYRTSVELDSLSKEHRGMIVEQLAIDSIDNYNIDELREILVRESIDLPGVDDPINVDWDKARTEFLDPNNTAPWMHFSDLESICRKHGIKDNSAIEIMASTYIHRLGRGVWYGLDWPDDPNLRDTIVRDPTWLSQAFMQLVQHERTREAGGMLEHNYLKEAWQGHENKDWIEYEVSEFARLMPVLREQGVALPTRGSEGRRSLVPQLVPYNRPELPWTDANDLGTGKKLIRIRTTLAPDVDGIMPQLIALLEPYHFYPDEAECGAFWTEGIFLRDEGARYKNDALIHFHRERSHAVIETTVVGEQPGFLWHQIDRSISLLEDYWPGLARKDEVFCTTHDETYCRGRFELEDVVQAQQHNDTIKCPKCRVSHDAHDLIMGLTPVQRRYGKDDVRYDLQYLRHRDERPAPRSVLIVPVEAKMNWGDIKNWEILGRKRLKAVLLSEFSGAVVAEQVFTADKGLFKFLGPVVKIGSAFAGAPLPFELPQGIESVLSDMSDTLSRLEELPQDEEVALAPAANLYLMRQFLDAVGLDPQAHGMGLEKFGREWYWMSAEELKQHRSTPAALPDFS